MTGSRLARLPALRRLGVTVLGLLGIALPLAAGDAQAAFPGRNGIVMYEGKRSAGGVLYARRPDGTRFRRVGGDRPTADPAFSPHGRRVAFSSGGEIWWMYVDGFGLQQVTARSEADGNPAWSPAGDALAFESGAPGRRDVHSIGAGGAGLRRLTYRPTDDHSPAWSALNRIAFVRRTRKAGDDIYVMDAAGTSATRLTRGRADDRGPAWSPDGRRIVFTRGSGRKRDLYVMRADGGRVRRLTRLEQHVSSPAWSPDGRRIVFSAGPTGKRRLYVVGARGRSLRRLRSGTADTRSPDWQPAGIDPVVAAAGDIACDPTSPDYANGVGTAGRCHQRQTSDLLMTMDLWAVLMLGDAQYEDGKLEKFMQSFDPTWGRLKRLIRPALGNHEYRDPGASGYFDYFNGPGPSDGPAGTRGAGYYSFEIGTWHVVALNSQCSHPPRNPTGAECAAGSAQEQWLRADLAARPRTCTLAFWHHPLVSSGLAGVNAALRPIWQVLYDAGVDLVLTGHDHAYERFAPLDPAGGADPVRGIRQFVVGTGGKSLQRATAAQPASELRDSTTYGVLKLTLRPRSYDWTFVPEAGGRFTDTGSSPCH